VTGASVGLLQGGGAGSLVPLSFGALALFWLRTPLESWMGTTPIRARTPAEIRLVKRTVFGLATVAAAAFMWLFWGGRNQWLVWIGAAAAAAFLTQAAVKWIWRDARMAAQMIGAAGLTATAPAAYFVVTYRWNGMTWSLWVANLLFAVNQIQFVQLRIRAARSKTRRDKMLLGRGFLAGQAALIALLAAACIWHRYPWYGALAFVPILVRGFAWFGAAPRPLVIHALGKSELAYACVFGVLLVIGIGPL